MSKLIDGACPGGCSQEGENPPHALKRGTLLDERYLIGAVIGEGGFGITYVGRDLTLEMRVAIKEYFPKTMVNRTTSATDRVTVVCEEQAEFVKHEMDRFLSEAQLLAHFSEEPGIVGVRNFFKENGTAYLVMEYLEGHTLRAELERTGKMAPEQVLNIMTPVMKSLSVVHTQGLIHRDISPDNIMLLPNGTVKLLDFGTARQVATETSNGLSVMLKPGYAPEEQYVSKGCQGPWTDVYGLCATMYHCMTGVQPVDALERAIHDTLVPPEQLNPTIDAHISQTLLKGMAKRREDRYQSVAELEQALNTLPVSAHANSGTVLIDEGQPGGGGGTRIAADRATAPSATSPVAPTTAPASVTAPVSVTAAAGPATAPASVIAPEKPAPSTPSGPVPAAPLVSIHLTEKETPARKVAKEAKAKASCFTKKMKKWIPLLTTLTTLAVVVGGFLAWRSSQCVVICGKEYDQSSYSVSFDDSEPLTTKTIKKVSRLKNVEKLYFFGVEINNDMIDMVSKLPQITELNFSRCTGPYSVARLSECENLELLSITKPEENVFEGLSKPFTNLKYLSVSEFPAMGKNAAAYLFHFPNLETLRLLSCDISDISWVSNLPTLRRLSIESRSSDEYPNAVKDLTPLAACPELSELSISGNRVTSLSGLENCTKLCDISIDNNQITSLQELENSTELLSVDADNNALTTLSGLENHSNLKFLFVNNNAISDISALEGSTNLFHMEAKNNKIQDLTPLAANDNLHRLHVGDNELSTLSGCESLISLTQLFANGNHLLNLNEIENCSVLEEVNFAHNNLTNVDILHKSANTLKAADISYNELADIAPFSGMVALQYLNIQGNAVEDLSPLSSSTGLLGLNFAYNSVSTLLPLSDSPCLAYLDGNNNKLTDISPLANAKELAYLDLSSNLITDVSPLVECVGGLTIPGSIYLYLEHNQIKEFSKLPALVEYNDLSLYDNPIVDYAPLAEMDVRACYLPYRASVVLDPLTEARMNLYFVDTPLDQQKPVEKAVRAGNTFKQIEFFTGEQADEYLAENKAVDTLVRVLGGNDFASDVATAETAEPSTVATEEAFESSAENGEAETEATNG